MKYTSFHKIFSVALALLVLVSTLSVSIEKHYCGDHLVDLALFVGAEKCGMEATDMEMPSSEEEQALLAKSCCKDVVNLHEGQDELSLEKTLDLDDSQKIFLISFASVFGHLNVDHREADSFDKPIPPPKTVRDIQVLHQVFLI